MSGGRKNRRTAEHNKKKKLIKVKQEKAKGNPLAFSINSSTKEKFI
jgi:hypothetical protein